MREGNHTNVQLTCKYKRKNGEEELREPDNDNCWCRNVDCSLAAEILDDIKTVILNDQVCKRIGIAYRIYLL